MGGGPDSEEEHTVSELSDMGFRKPSQVSLLSADSAPQSIFEDQEEHTVSELSDMGFRKLSQERHLSVDSAPQSIFEDQELSTDSPEKLSARSSMVMTVPRVFPPTAENGTGTLDTSNVPEDSAFEEGDTDTGIKTPGTDISSVSQRYGTPQTAAKVGRSLSVMSNGKKSSSTIAEFRQNQMKCLEALRKGARAAAVTAAMRQTSEPVKQGMGGLSKQVSEESNISDRYSERYSDIAAVGAPNFSPNDPLVADPLVAVVKSISSRQQQAHEQLLVKLGDMRQEAAVQRQEMKDILRRHAHEIDELKDTKKKGKGLSVVKTFAAAFGVAVGISNVMSLCKSVCKGEVFSAPARSEKVATFVLPRSAAAARVLAKSRPRRVRSSTRR